MCFGRQSLSSTSPRESNAAGRYCQQLLIYVRHPCSKSIKRQCVPTCSRKSSTDLASSLQACAYLQWKVLPPDSLGFVGAIAIYHIRSRDDNTHSSRELQNEGLAVMAAKLIWQVRGVHSCMLHASIPQNLLDVFSPVKKQENEPDWHAHNDLI